MKRSYIRLFCLGFLLISTACFGQKFFEIFETQHKGETLGQLIKVADNYFAGKEKTEELERRHEKKKETGQEETGEDEGEYFQYKRWEYDMLWHFRLDQVPGNYTASNFQAYYQYQKEHKKTTAARSTTNDFNGNWRLFGPTTFVAPDLNHAMGRINVVVADPDNSNIIYLGAPAGGLWRSTDQGVTWACLTDGMPTVGVSGIVIDPNPPSGPKKIFILTGDVSGRPACQGVFVSSNDGVSWSKTSYPLPSSGIAYKIIQNPTSHHLLAVSADGIHRSIDGGATWAQVKTGNFCDVEYHPTNSQIVYASTGFGSTGSGGRFYRSTDGGVTWNETSVGSSSLRGEIAVTRDPLKPNKVYFVSENNKIYISTDAGVSFPSSYTLPNYSYTQPGRLAIAASPTNGDIVLTGSVGSFRSTDGGVTWSASLPNVHVDFQELNYVGNTLYIGTDGGIYKSTDNGVSASFIGNGVPITQFHKIGGHANDANYVLGAANDNGGNGIFKNTGVMEAYFGGDGYEIFIDPNDNTIYGSSQYGGLIKGHAGDPYFINAIPTGIVSGGDPDTPFLMDPNNQNTLYVGYVDVYKSTNKAVSSSWNNITTGKIPASTGNCTNIAVAPSNSNVIYVSKSNLLYGTQTGGSSWTPLVAPTTDRIKRIVVSPKDPSKMWILLGTKVYYSTDGASSLSGWTDISGTLPPISVNTLIYQNNSKNRLYLGTDVGVYYKDDDHTDWQLFTDGLPATIVKDLDINYENNLLRAGTYGRGIWETELICDDPAPVTLTAATGGIQFYSGSTITSSSIASTNSNIGIKASESITFTEPFSAKSDDNVILRAYLGTDLCGTSTFAPTPLTGTYEGPMPGLVELITKDTPASTETDFVIFPNPAKELTNIEFILKEKAAVELAIYDMLGNRIAQALTASNLEQGTYEFNLSTNNLVQGLYVVSLRLNEKVFQKKLTIVK